MATAVSGTSSNSSETARGFALALGAYLIWGLLPFYMKAVAHIPAAEVVAHRVIWSLPIGALLLARSGRLGTVIAALRDGRMLLRVVPAAVLITINWLTYVWAIAVGRALETALGYYINPLVSILVGALLLRERFSRAQMLAIALAALGVIGMSVLSGGLPWVSLVLAFSFAGYGYFKKTVPIGSTEGFVLEILLLTLPALVFIAYLVATGQSHFTGEGAHLGDILLLMASGLLTAVPLIMFGIGARALRLSTIGIMQYVAPTMVFFIAVFYFGEPLNAGKLVAFGFIWAALAIYSWSALSTRR
jgi:chloramphenicol-sensitive protein RarD